MDKARCREEGCSGLGLAMVKQIAIIHGGNVTVESEPDKKTTISVLFDKKYMA